MSEAIEKDFDSIINCFNMCAAIVGQSVTNEVWYRYPRSIYRWLVVVLIVSVFSCMYPFIMEHLDDLVMIAQCNVHITIIGQVSIKLIVYSIQRKKIIQLIDMIRVFRKDKIKTEKELELCKTWTKKSIVAPRFIVAFYMSTMIPAIIIGIVSRALPYALQLPFIPPDVTPYYELNFLYQILAFFMAILMTTVFDGLFAFFLQEASLQLDVLQEKISHIGEVVSDDDDTLAQQLEEVHNLHVMHLESNEYVYLVNEVFNYMLFLQFVASTFVVTFLLISVAMSDEFNLGMYSLIGSFSVEIFLWSWFGEQARTRMNRMVEAMYSSYWFQLKPTAQKSLMIMMSCSQKEFSLSAGGLIDLTLSTFVSIMRTAYSYYAVMADSNSK